MPYLLTHTRKTNSGEETLLIDSFDDKPDPPELTDALLSAGLSHEEEPEIRASLLKLKPSKGWELKSL